MSTFANGTGPSAILFRSLQRAEALYQRTRESSFSKLSMSSQCDTVDSLGSPRRGRTSGPTPRLLHLLASTPGANTNSSPPTARRSPRFFATFTRVGSGGVGEGGTPILNAVRAQGCCPRDHLFLHRRKEPALHVLFVCTGNICRSPSAERLALAYCDQAGITDFSASSAGTSAVIGHPVHPDAERVLQAMGGDASNFAARQLTPKIASNADLILTMTRSHRDSVLELAPNKFKRTFSLPEAAHLVRTLGAQTIADLANLRPKLIMSEVPDIVDPIGRSDEVFTAVGGQIADLLPPVLELCRP